MTRPGFVRPLWTVGLSVLIGCGLPLLLLWLAKTGHHVDFVSTEPAPGDDREVTTGATLAVWACALAPVLAVTLAAAWPKAGLWLRLSAAVAAAIAVVISRSWIVSMVAERFKADVGNGVWAGALLGLAAALLVAWRPVLGYGIAAHAGVLWAPALLVPGAGAFAGWAGGVSSHEGGLYFFALLAVVAALSTWLILRHNTDVVLAGAGGAAGPVLAVLTYVASPHIHYGWDGLANQYAVVVAFITLFAAVFTIVLTQAVREQRART